MRNFLSILILSFLLYNCNSGTTPATDGTILPNSTGGTDEIMFVVPDHLYGENMDKIIADNFSEYYKLLPQPEDKFKISTVKFSQLNSLLYRFRNIVFISSYDTKDTISNLAAEIVGQEKYSEQKNVLYKKNVWANNQLITILLSPTQSNIGKTLAENSESISATISNNELDAYRKLAYINGVNTKLREQLVNFYGLSFDVPVNYKLATNEGSFVSFRGDNEKSTFYLFFDVVKFDEPVEDINKGIEFRNERGKYVSSNVEGSYVTSDSTLGFFTERIEKDDFIIYENRGLWSMENDFMGGPFINRYIIDIKENRVILLDGFVYGPGDKNKLKLMRQFEAIFSTFKRAEK